MGNIILTKFGFGQESSFGTAVTATRFIPCTVMVEPVIGNYAPVLYRGSYDAAFESAQGGKVANWNLTMDARQADLPMFLEGLVGTSYPTVATFDTSGRRRTYATSNTSARKSITMEQNDSDVDWLLTSMLPTSLSVSGSEADRVAVSMNGFAYDYADNGSPTAYVNEIKTPLMSWQRIFSMDSAGTTPGTTAVDGRVVSFNFGLGNNAGYVYSKNNSQLIGATVKNSFAPSMSMRLLMSTDRYLFSEFGSGTVKVFCIELRGPLVSAAYQGIKLIVCGKVLSYKQNPFKGLNAVDLTIQPIVDSTLGYSANVIVASTETTV